MRPHAVDPVRPLALILQQQHGVLEHRHKRGANDAGEHRQIAADEPPLGAAGNVGIRARECGSRGAGLKQPEKPLVGGSPQASELRQHRTVDADPAVCLQPQVQRGDIREADQELALPGRRPCRQACPAAASPRSRRARRTPPVPGGPRSRRAIRSAGGHRPRRGSGGELKDSLRVLRTIPVRQHFQAELEGRAIEAARRGDDRHAVTGPYGAGRSENGAGHACGPLHMD